MNSITERWKRLSERARAVREGSKRDAVTSADAVREIEPPSNIRNYRPPRWRGLEVIKVDMGSESAERLGRFNAERNARRLAMLEAQKLANLVFADGSDNEFRLIYMDGAYLGGTTRRRATNEMWRSAQGVAESRIVRD